MQRETFKSRLGFILLSAGCAIGIGNVWRFPYVVGTNGGGAFVLIYLFFLLVMGVPILTMEFAIGRASGQSIAKAYNVLEKKGQKWHLHGYISMVGNYLLMMFYTTVSGWMLYYCYGYATGRLYSIPQEQVGNAFGELLSRPGTMSFWMILVVVLGFAVCSLGLQNGVEKISKYMMLALLGTMILLMIHSFTMKGGAEGIRFYLYPDFEKMKEIGVWQTVSAAMNQAFFTLSIGMGSMMIFGSYLKKEKTLLGESVSIALLDTFVALISGLIIFPACFAYGVSPDSGPSLIFITLPNIFNEMAGGRIWGSLFFLFMSFASFSTIIAVFENIMTCCTDRFEISRKKAAIINLPLLIVLSLPCVLGFNVLSGFQPLGAGTGILDLEDFLVSNLILPCGSLVFLIFCTRRYGWGFDNYLKEANTGSGMKLPAWLRFYLSYILPLLVLVLIVQGLI